MDNGRPYYEQKMVQNTEIGKIMAQNLIGGSKSPRIGPGRGLRQRNWQKTQTRGWQWNLVACLITNAPKKINKALKHPTVMFLRAHMEKAGCPFWVNLIHAANCTPQGVEGVAAGYNSGDGIFICCDNLKYQDQINQALIHELIHAYDDCRIKNLDMRNIRHLACSEIRAYHLSGDCHFKRELLRGYMKIRGHEQECVRRRALDSVRNNGYGSNSEAASKDAVEAVWDICYNDTYPFEKAP